MITWCPEFVQSSIFQPRPVKANFKTLHIAFRVCLSRDVVILFAFSSSSCFYSCSFMGMRAFADVAVTCIQQAPVCHLSSCLEYLVVYISRPEQELGWAPQLGYNHPHPNSYPFSGPHYVTSAVTVAVR
jgi:hypothetical protein